MLHLLTLRISQIESGVNPVFLVIWAIVSGSVQVQRTCFDQHSDAIHGASFGFMSCIGRCGALHLGFNSCAIPCPVNQGCIMLADLQ
jgi:hypothetical protein